MHDFLLALVHLDATAMVTAGGYLGIALIIFMESGLLLGIFFPGDSLLFVAGLLAGGGTLSLSSLFIVAATAAILGDSAGYWFGKKIGPSLFSRPDSRFFKQAYVERTKEFYATYGRRTIVLARFVPIVRTIAPIVAGATDMPYRRFISYNVIGGTLWTATMLVIGFSLGRILPSSEHYLLPFSLLIIFVSFFPFFLHLLAKPFRRA